MTALSRSSRCPSMAESHGRSHLPDPASTKDRRVHGRPGEVAVTVRATTLKGAAAGAYYVEALPNYYLDADEPRGIWHGVRQRMAGQHAHRPQTGATTTRAR